jgi:hypothetical protein
MGRLHFNLYGVPTIGPAAYAMISPLSLSLTGTAMRVCCFRSSEFVE